MLVQEAFGGPTLAGLEADMERWCPFPNARLATSHPIPADGGAGFNDMRPRLVRQAAASSQSRTKRGIAGVLEDTSNAQRAGRWAEQEIASLSKLNAVLPNQVSSSSRREILSCGAHHPAVNPRAVLSFTADLRSFPHWQLLVPLIKKCSSHNLPARVLLLGSGLRLLNRLYKADIAVLLVSAGTLEA
jgi:hypothetical protein